MTPAQIAGTTEHSQQAAFFCWANSIKKDYPMLRFMFAVPNGGERNKVAAARLVAEGVKSGAPDIFLPYPKIRNNQVLYHGLFIEMKRPKSVGLAAGRLTANQIEFQDYLISQNYAHIIAFDYLQAANAVLEYLN